MSFRRVVLIAFLGICPLSAGCKKQQAPAPTTQPTTVQEEAPKPTLPAAPALDKPPLGLPEMEVPADTAMTADKVELGKTLFFDKRLSADGSASCQHCHVHEKGWTDGLQFSTKVGGAVNTRNSPTMYNVGYQTNWYWDGRATNLEAQVAAAWKGHMAGDPDKTAAALAQIPWYTERFERAFNSAPSGDNIAAALAAFVRTFVSGNAPWDKYEAGDKSAVSEDAVKGYEIFRDKARCTLCHVPPLFTDLSFHNVGVGIEKANKAPADVGRFKVSSDPKDTGAFKTPSLRSVTKTGPYFHDGSVATLEEAVKFMVAGGKKNKWRDEKLKPTKLSDAEFAQLMAFIKALESDEPFEAPTIP